MQIPFKRSLNALNDFVESKRFDKKLAGIIVFGSFVKGMLHKTSDIDVLLLTKNGEYSRKIKEYDGLKFEIYTAPIAMFMSPFNNKGNLFFDMFRLQVLRTGRILYNQNGLLSQLNTWVNDQKILRSYERTLLSRAYKRLRHAEKYFWVGYLNHAESELQAASIEVARTLLLRKNKPEINIPRLIIPHLRKLYPDFYKIFQEIHGLDNFGKNDVELELYNSLNYLEKINDKYNAAEYLGSVIKRADLELSNAKDCLEYGDYDSAILQLRLFTSILNNHLPMKFKFNTCGFNSRHSARSSNKIKEELSILREALSGL